MPDDLKQTTIYFETANQVELVRKAVRRSARPPSVCYRAWLLTAAGLAQKAAEVLAESEPPERPSERRVGGQLARVKDKGGTAINVKMPAAEWALVQPEADRTGLPFATWVRLVLLSVAGTDHGAQLAAQLRRLERAA